MKSRWYKNAVVYQIYPFSFMDSNNDGFGDIEGIISKLDYIRDLGATAIWFSPLYKSPDYDYGYDVSDYKAIDEKFGTMEDFDRLVRECHRRDLKVIMDMVINHTSTEHPWFQEAISSPDSPYRDYYIIRKGRIEGANVIPPSNWESTFTGSAWERIGDSDDFYLHLFCKEQADLNWENPDVRREMIDILNFWFEKGVDGFRFDVFNMFSKVYPIQDDTSKDSFQKGAPYYVDGPRMHEFLKELNEKSFSLYDSFTVGESFHPSFDLLQFKDGFFNPQRAAYGEGWNTLVLENHDNPRCVNRFSINASKYRYEAATMLAVVTYMGLGTPFIYMGQEAGLVNCDFKSIDEMMDPVSHFVYDLMTGYGMPKWLAFRFIKYGARDHSRVPIAWDDSANGGFNDGHAPWQCVNPKYPEINIKKDIESEKSVYRFYRKLLRIRKTHEAAVMGEIQEYDHENRRVIAYSRTYQGKKLFICANFSKYTTIYNFPDELGKYKIVLNNYQVDGRPARLPFVGKKGQKLILKPYQAVVLSCLP